VLRCDLSSSLSSETQARTRSAVLLRSTTEVENLKLPTGVTGRALLSVPGQHWQPADPGLAVRGSESAESKSD